MDFTDKIVLVTGGSRGIGRSISQQFAENGARIAINYKKNLAAAEKTKASLGGGSHMIVQTDIGDSKAVQNMVDKVVSEMGGLDIVVNNAGIFEEHPAHNVDYDQWLDQWKRIMSTNLFGAANLCYCAVQHFLKQGGGRIVNVGSRGAFRGEPDSPAYGASKAGLHAMGQSLAKSLAPFNIFVHNVAPGFVETEMAVEDLKGKKGDEIRGQSPLNRVAKPEEIAHTVLFLASKETEFLTGCIVDVNGASYLRT